MRDRFINPLRGALLACLFVFAANAGFAQIAGDATDHVFTWRYEKETENGRLVVKRLRMTWPEGEAWDKERIDGLVQRVAAGEVYGVPPGSDPLAIATWKHYYDQLSLWEKYIVSLILPDVPLPIPAAAPPPPAAGGARDEAAPANGGASLVDRIMWAVAGGPAGQQAAAYHRTGAEAVVAANQYTSMDDQVGGFFTFGRGGAEPPPPVITRDHILRQVLSLFGLMRDLGKQADEVTYRHAQALIGGLTDREGRRLAYRNWLDDRKQIVIETALDWGRQQDGQVVVVDGIQFELYSPAQGLPMGAGAANVVRVVTDHLTPYDLLNPDGTRKEPLRR